MDSGHFGGTVQQQGQNSSVAEITERQVAANRPDRFALSILFAKKHLPTDGRQVHPHLIIDPYPPSVSPLTTLIAITIPDLRLETHHRGRVLIVRTFGHPHRVVGVENAVEDVNGNVDRIVIYNEAEDANPDQILPKGAVFAIKEPFYEVTAHGEYTIRVDHPSDLHRLQPTDPQYPSLWQPKTPASDKSAAECKDEGNVAYRAKDYLAAIDAYTRGLKIAQIGSRIMSDLLRNRAMVNLLVGRYEAAEIDGRAGVMTGTANFDNSRLDSKSLYRAGRAAYELGKFESAERAFRDALALTPDDEDIESELKRCLQRTEEVHHGAFDFSESAKIGIDLDHANFTSNTRMDRAGTHGRGLFATKDIKAGELVLCEKAFDLATPVQAKNNYTLINLNTNRAGIGPHACLFYAVVQKLRNNPVQASRFLDLYDGAYRPKCTAEVVDGATVIDTFQVQAIIEYNCFCCNDPRSMTDPSTGSGAENVAKLPVGIWTTASLVNHACAGNTYRSFIGDMLLLYATRDIARGEEITMPYRLPNSDYEDTRDFFQRTWGFECDCAICIAERATPPAQRAQRKTSVAKLSLLRSAHKRSPQNQPNRTTLEEAERMYRNLERSYGPQFNGVPRVGLVRFGMWLCETYNNASLTSKTLDMAMKMLYAAGFKIDVVDGNLHVVRGPCVMVDLSLVHAAVYAAYSHLALNELAIGCQFQSFAQQLYKITGGTDKEFGERYGSSADVLLVTTLALSLTPGST